MQRQKHAEKRKGSKPSEMIIRYAPISKTGTLFLGFGIVAVSLMTSVIGVKSSLSAMDVAALNEQQAQKVTVTTKPVVTPTQAPTVKPTPIPTTTPTVQPTVTPEPTVQPTPTSEATPMPEQDAEKAWMSEQMQWMMDNHISWNDEGYPVDENGNVVDDPTTSVNEVERYEASLAKPVTPESSVTETPEKEQTWYEKNPMIVSTGDGLLFYVVQPGDTLSGIAQATGFTVQELADYNNIVNADFINVAQRIYFSAAGPTVLDKTLGLG